MSCPLSEAQPCHGPKNENRIGRLWRDKAGVRWGRVFYRHRLSHGRFSRRMSRMDTAAGARLAWQVCLWVMVASHTAYNARR